MSVTNKRLQKTAAPVPQRKTRQQRHEEDEEDDDDDDGSINVPFTRIRSAANEARRGLPRTINGLQSKKPQAVTNATSEDEEDEESVADEIEVEVEGLGHSENEESAVEEIEVEVEGSEASENDLFVSQKASPPKRKAGRPPKGRSTGKQAQKARTNAQLQDIYEFESSPVKETPLRRRQNMSQGESSRTAARSTRQQRQKPSLAAITSGGEDQDDEDEESEEDEEKQARRHAESEARNRRAAERQKAERRAEEEAERRAAQQFAHSARATQALRNFKDPLAEKMARYNAASQLSASYPPATKPQRSNGKDRAVQQDEDDEDPFANSDGGFPSPVHNGRGSHNRYARNGVSGPKASRTAAAASSQPSDAWSKEDEIDLIKAVRKEDYNLYDMANRLERSAADVATKAASIKARYRMIYRNRGENIPEWAL